MGKQSRILEHIPDPAPLGRNVDVLRGVQQNGIAQRDPSRIGIEQAANDIDQCGFAAAGAAKQRYDPRSGQVEFGVQRKRTPMLEDGHMKHQRPNNRRRRWANHSDNTRPPRPRMHERRARRAAASSPPGVCNAVYSARGRVRVSPGMLETNVMTAPNSPSAAENAVMAPAKTPGSIKGRVIVANRSIAPAPRVRAASSRPRSMF